ncbi:hypothetical protein RchiOBHm_Chr4g0420961 [Rosa chinensis]|uniref:Uncharacterized protein n=1 Tax=Rosa chinensis TaxID=74649 RepID=A0A2P6QY48_ROSCH|nr:hypothetical protein RchiOBHm_Chr4g0420961 [Rosa chinensis]
MLCQVKFMFLTLLEKRCLRAFDHPEPNPSLVASKAFLAAQGFYFHLQSKSCTVQCLKR